MSSARRAGAVIAGAAILLLALSASLPHSTQRTSSGASAERGTLLQRVGAEQQVPVAAVAAEYQSLRRTLSLAGSIQSAAAVSVGAAAPGTVASLFVHQGSHVRSGQALAEMDAAQAESQVAVAREAVLSANTALQKADAARALTVRQLSGEIQSALLMLQEARIGVQKASAGPAAAAVAQAQANARQAHAAAAQASRALSRTQFLYSHEVVPLSALEDVRAKAEQASAAADAADALVRQLREGASAEDRQLAREKAAEAAQNLKQAQESRAARIAVADSDVQAAMSQLLSAREQLRQAELQASRTRITSPVDGVVTAVRVHSGESASPGEPVFTITSLARAYFRAAVSEGERGQLSPGQLARITLPTLPGRVFIGQVSSVSPVENPGAAGFEVRIGIQPADVLLPPGASARAEVQTGAVQHALVIPLAAIVPQPHGGKAVFIAVEGRAVLQSITTGIADEERVEVISGLKVGQQVITRGAELLADGDRISLQSGDSS